MNFSIRIQFWCHTVFENKPKKVSFCNSRVDFQVTLKFKSTFYASVLLSIFGAKIQIYLPQM